MKQEILLRTALDSAINNGIKIRRVPVFDFTSLTKDGLPSTCCATGAVLLHINYPSLKKGWLKLVCKHLDVDTWWLYRFWQGWDHNKELTVSRTDCFSGDDREEKDSVSKFGKALARKYVQDV